MIGGMLSAALNVGYSAAISVGYNAAAAGAAAIAGAIPAPAEEPIPEVNAELQAKIQAERLNVCPLYLIINLARLHFVSESERVFSQNMNPDVKLDILDDCSITMGVNNLRNRAQRTLSRGRASRNQLVQLRKHFIKLWKWFPIQGGEFHPHLRSIYECGAKGLEELSKTYNQRSEAKSQGQILDLYAQTVSRDLKIFNEVLAADDEPTFNALIEPLEKEMFSLNDEILIEGETRGQMMEKGVKKIWNSNKIERIVLTFKDMEQNICDMSHNLKDPRELMDEFNCNLTSLDALIAHIPRSFLKLRNRIDAFDTARLKVLSKPVVNEV